MIYVEPSTLNILMAFLTAFTIAFLAVPPVIRVSSIRRIFDEPDERKQHKNSIPSLGGVAMFAAIFFSIIFWAQDINFEQLRWMILPLFIIFMQGLKDDIVAIHAVKKLIGQLIATAIMVFWGGLYIDDLQGILGIGPIPAYVSIPFTLFTVAVIINSFNLIDGVDGLAGTIGVVTTVTFGTLFFLGQHYSLALISFTITGALLGFLWYNFSPAKIFMGDGGSLVIGMVLGILCIRFLDAEIRLEDGGPALPTPPIALAILIVPLTDTLRVFMIRMSQGKSPFSPDRNHLHHVLLRLGFNHRQVALTLGGINLAFIMLALLLRNVDITVATLVIIGTSVTACVVLQRLSSRKKLDVPAPAMPKPVNVEQTA
ncbi:MAG: Undecaprenyl-phosphate alpha-N-acetylglucosaminyl 1-phosphate transferase [uncultured Cytophagales bacterium]|uniref:Undecaprenyl-phosphate alpha-N-acetylglucosaminyl 1-phosphate transferase n=1 Tax=uncultured Cytophagales bacterium TaxID=158755 RepID=A0A6J4HNP0_9SPHI|nr:MAG: Undecaprenyl-phosphate alpha-N-acetylglucosaminyl 1-phosphate transferase [uncultured Cytophagales bacterium]